MREFIIGTDWWTDCDDAVAMRIAARAHKNEEIKILGVGINACMEYSVSSLKYFFEAEGVFDLPYGIDHDATDYGGTPSYQKNLSKLSDSNFSNFDAMSAVGLYRKLLSGAAGKVEIVEIGFPQILSGLLLSHPDGFSPLNGYDLVKEKVSKIWMMAGKWDVQGGREHNFEKTARSRNAAEIFCRLCPVPTTFLGFEIGVSVISGGELAHDDLLYKVLCDHGSKNGRSSWDPMLMLMAVIGDEEKAGYNMTVGKARVDAATGENFFDEGDGMHAFVTKKHCDEYYKNAINERISSTRGI